MLPVVNWRVVGHFPKMHDGERPFHEIVQARLAELGENAFSMAGKSGVSYDKFRNVLRNDDRRADPKVETAREICAALGLEFYIGPPRDVGPVQQIVLDGNEFAQIPVHEAALAAGCGVENSEAEVIGHLAFRRSWLKAIGVAASSAVLARAWGDSMLPTIQSGDMLLIDSTKSEVPVRTRSKHDHRPGQIYAILDDGLARVKRIERPEDGLLILTSDNPACGAEVLTGQRMKSLNIIGRVMWWGHTNRE